MKLLLVLLAISIYCFGLIEAGPNGRTKRSEALGTCPADQDCEEYVKEMIKGRCAFYDVKDGQYGIGDCGLIECGSRLKITEEDLSKPYPDCCSKCVKLDE